MASWKCLIFTASFKKQKNKRTLAHLLNCGESSNLIYFNWAHKQSLKLTDMVQLQRLCNKRNARGLKVCLFLLKSKFFLSIAFSGQHWLSSSFSFCANPFCFLLCSLFGACSCRVTSGLKQYKNKENLTLCCLWHHCTINGHCFWKNFIQSDIWRVDHFSQLLKNRTFYSLDIKKKYTFTPWCI